MFSLMSGVYPRVYGGTNATRMSSRLSMGLSPRVRGNRASYARDLVEHGSIPACTGEPLTATEMTEMIKVYPRVYGGTPFRAVTVTTAIGLSPRVRGNLAEDALRGEAEGSIPACTGEPSPRQYRTGIDAVYPRVYGGTARIVNHPPILKGLSPRVRGNLDVFPCCQGLPGSIPACTGEPSVSARAALYAAVYPRVYGGTRHDLRGRQAPAGLSPRVRGNLVSRGDDRSSGRSIPACTGEPH